MISGLERRLERPGLLEGPRIEAGGGAAGVGGIGSGEPGPPSDLAVIFSDVMGGGVHRLLPDGGVETVLERRRGIGGLVPHADGGVVVTGRSVAHGERELFAGDDGIRGFNDLTTDAEGRVLAGALRYRPMAGEDPLRMLEGAGHQSMLEKHEEFNELLERFLDDVLAPEPPARAPRARRKKGGKVDGPKD